MRATALAQARNTGPHGSSEKAVALLHNDPGSIFKAAQREFEKILGAALTSGAGAGPKRRQPQESAGQSQTTKNMQNGANTSDLSSSVSGGG